MKRLRFYWRARKFLRKWDPSEIQAMLGILRKGDVAFDVGCHKGGWLYWMRRAVGPTGQVHAFEPQPELAKYLQEIARAFKWRNVFIHTCALGSEPGHQNLHVPDTTGATSASASLIPDVASSESSHVPTIHKVQLTTLDHFIEDQGLERVDFIKIDVEGFELETLTGAQKTLASLHPAIMVECEQRHLNPQNLSLRQVFEAIQKHNYTGHFFPNATQTPIESFAPATHQNQTGDRFWDHPTYTNNFLFQPTPRM